MDEGRITEVLESGLIVYRASSAGTCIKALVADRRGEIPKPPSQWLEAIFAAGWAYEEDMIGRLRDLGWQVRGQQQEYVLDVIPGKVVIIGHVDGVATSPAGIDHVLEMKTQGPSVFPVWERRGQYALRADLRYATQATCAMRGLGMPMLYVRMQRCEPTVALADRPFGTFVVSDDPVSWATVCQKIAIAEAMVQRHDEWPQCDVATEKSRCFFDYLHDVEPPVYLPELDSALQQLWELQAQADALGAQIDELKQQIWEAASAAGNPSRIRGTSGAGVTLTHSTNQVRYDMDRIKTRLGDEIADFVRETPIRRLLLTHEYERRTTKKAQGSRFRPAAQEPSEA